MLFKSVLLGIASLIISTSPVLVPRGMGFSLISQLLGLGLGIASSRQLREEMESRAIYLHDRQEQLRAVQTRRSRSLFPEECPPLISSKGREREALLILKQWGIEADYLGKTRAPSFDRIRIRLRKGTAENLGKRLLELQAGLGLLNMPIIDVDPETETIAIDLERGSDREFVQMTEYLSKPDNTVKAAIGVDLNFQPIELPLADPNFCHILIGGTTGSGKTELVRVILYSLLTRYSPDKLRIGIVDPKRVTFNELQEAPWLIAPIAKTPEDALAMMVAIEAEMMERYKLMEAIGVDDYSKMSWDKPRIVIIYDEYANLILDKKFKAKFEKIIKNLGAMARAAGIHLILATQRPSADVITPLIRSNLPVRVALRTTTIQDSQIILGGEDTRAARLLGKGDLLLQAEAQTRRLQSFRCDILGYNPTQQPRWQLEKPKEPSSKTEIDAEVYREYRRQGLSPDRYLRDLGFKGGRSYQSAKAELKQQIETILGEWIDEIETDDPAKIVEQIWNYRKSSKGYTTALRTVEAHLRGELASNPEAGPQSNGKKMLSVRKKV